jgi:ABC-type bacteriocin/lantibiotic exporter with double-glycine peptidase domain
MKSIYSINEIVPALAIIAATAFRVLPAFSRLFQSLQGLKYFKKSVENIYDISKSNSEIVEPVIDKKKQIAFDNVIELKNIFFNYPNNENKIFQNLNFYIKKNEMIGVLGESGSGKSTFLDIFCGLLKPQNGEFFIDNKIVNTLDNSWRNNFAYVQQATTIFNESFKANIILDKLFDKKLFFKIISIVKLDNFLKKLPINIETKLGEFGSKISGGEAQRIGIARALYRSPSILIMDEPTSSLDNQTENDLVENLKVLKNKITIIIISHKINTLKNCDEIYEIKNKCMIKKNET